MHSTSYSIASSNSSHPNGLCHCTTVIDYTTILIYVSKSGHGIILWFCRKNIDTIDVIKIGV